MKQLSNETLHRANLRDGVAKWKALIAIHDENAEIDLIGLVSPKEPGARPIIPKVISLLGRAIAHARSTARYLVFYGEGRDIYDEPGRDEDAAQRLLFESRFCPSRPGHAQQYHRPKGWDYVPPSRKNPFGESSMFGDNHMRELALYVQRLVENKPYLRFF